MEVDDGEVGGPDHLGDLGDAELVGQFAGDAAHHRSLAGIAVADYAVALTWYERLLGSPPTFFPNDIEAVWELA